MRKSILIVNNDISTSFLIKMMLPSVNTVFKISNSYDDMVVCLKKKKYDLIITDAVIQGRFFFQYLEDLKKMSKKAPIVVISEIDQEGVVNIAKKIGVNDFISFPFSQSDIKKFIHCYL